MEISGRWEQELKGLRRAGWGRAVSGVCRQRGLEPPRGWADDDSAGGGAAGVRGAREGCLPQDGGAQVLGGPGRAGGRKERTSGDSGWRQRVGGAKKVGSRTGAGWR